MKTNQTLIIALLLALPLAYFAGCSTGSNTNTKLADGSTIQSADSPAGDSVNIDTVKNRIKLYRYWRSVLPDTAYYDSGWVTFNPREVTSEVANLLDSKGITKIPVSGYEEHPVAYFIPKYDLADMLNNVGKDIIGVRLYPAMDLVNLDSAYHGGRFAFLKVYGVPVNVYGRDTIPQYYGSSAAETTGQFAYDLTTPCPNTCDRSSELYEAATAQ